MNHSRLGVPQRVTRAGVALGAAMLLLGGATWRLSAAAPVNTPSDVAAVAMPQAHTVNGTHETYADVVKVVAPAVVTIRTERKASPAPTQFQSPEEDLLRRFFGDRGNQDRGEQDRMPRQPPVFKQRALGSGVIVDAEGYILTNNHVVDHADDVRVETTDGRTFQAKVIGTDQPSDLALLKINAPSLHPIALGDSDSVEVGDVVLAVGNPLGVGQTVTMGIISAKGRSTSAGSGRVSYEDFLQTDAPINQGNSGGALVNTNGELIGINSQILSESGGNIGIGFAIPSNMARHVMDALRTKGKVTRAQLGVSVQGLTSDMAESLGLKDVNGVIIGSVIAGSAADRAGLKRGDVVQAFNGQPVRDTNSLRNRVAEAVPGSTAQVTIVRNGSEKRISVKLDEALAAKAAEQSGEPERGDMSALGIAASPLTPELASRYGLEKDARGLVVEEVSPEGRAAAAGIQPGDVIEEVNQQPVQSVDELRTAVQKTTDRPLLLLVNREGNDIFLTVRPNDG